MVRLQSNGEEVIRSLEALLVPGQVFEVRVLDASRGREGITETLFGYFDGDHLQDLAKALGAVSYATGCYWTLNPVEPDLLSRAAYRLRKAAKGSATGDREVLRRVWLPIDLDPVRLPGISATDEEKARAFALAQRMVAYLAEAGWPAPVRLDSGNGAHLLYRVDLPVDDGGLVECCLKALDKRFSDAFTKVDTAVANPSRIWKLPGTPARKGDDTPSRPHRMAHLIELPRELQAVSVACLKGLASEVAVHPDASSEVVASRLGSFDPEEWIRRHGLDVQEPKHTDGGRVWVFRDCPWRPGDGESAFMAQLASGAMSAGCHHDTCPGSRRTGNHWRELRTMVEPPSDELGGRWPDEMAGPGRRSDSPGGVLSQASPLLVLDPSELMNCPIPENRWLLQELLPWGSPAILAGKSNVGKGMIAMQLSLAVATGRGLFGFPGTGQPKNVLMLGMEDDRNELHRRFLRCLDLLREEEDWGEADERLLRENWRAVVPVWTSSVQKTLTGLRDYLVAEATRLCRNGKPMGLIVLDTFAALSEGEENRAEVQQAFWTHCHTLAETTGATPLVVHHVRKALGAGGRPPSMGERLSFDNLRGSSAIVAGARAILQAEALTVQEAGRLGLDEDRALAGNYLVMALTKFNAGPKGAWVALDQRQAGEKGAGFFVPMANGTTVCVALKGRAALARLSLAEEVLRSIAEGCADREELARRHWASDTPEKAASKLKNMLQDLRRKYHWLQPGAMRLTIQGFEKAQMLRRRAGGGGSLLPGSPEGENLSEFEDPEDPTHLPSG